MKSFIKYLFLNFLVVGCLSSCSNTKINLDQWTFEYNKQSNTIDIKAGDNYSLNGLYASCTMVIQLRLKITPKSG
mgnify:CR=1 FL=1